MLRPVVVPQDLICDQLCARPVIYRYFNLFIFSQRRAGGWSGHDFREAMLTNKFHQLRHRVMKLFKLDDQFQSIPFCLLINCQIYGRKRAGLRRRITVKFDL